MPLPSINQQHLLPCPSILDSMIILLYIPGAGPLFEYEGGFLSGGRLILIYAPAETRSTISLVFQAFAIKAQR